MTRLDHALDEIESHLCYDGITCDRDERGVIVALPAWRRAVADGQATDDGLRGLGRYCASILDYERLDDIAVIVEPSAGPSPWLDGDELIVQAVAVEF